MSSWYTPLVDITFFGLHMLKQNFWCSKFCVPYYIHNDDGKLWTAKMLLILLKMNISCYIINLSYSVLCSILITHSGWVYTVMYQLHFHSCWHFATYSLLNSFYFLKILYILNIKNMLILHINTHIYYVYEVHILFKHMVLFGLLLWMCACTFVFTQYSHWMYTYLENYWMLNLIKLM